MVIPMPAMQGVGGDPPEHLLPHLQKIKWSVIVVFISSIGKLLTGFIPLNEIFYCISGVFLMKDDIHTGSAYRMLMRSPLGACAGPSGGGLTCITSVMFLGGINCLFGLFSIQLMLANPFNLICLIAQGIGVYYAWLCFDYLRGEAGPTGSLPGGFSGPTSGSRSGGGPTSYNPPTRGRSDNNNNNNSVQTVGNGSGGGGGGGSFVAFSGEGNKLGNA